MKEKRMVANVWETPDGTILWSRYAHDFVLYKDENGEEYIVDGGNDYCRMCDSQEHPMKNLCIFNTDPWDLQRQYILRGTYDSKDQPIWVPLAKLSNKHLENIIKDDLEYYGIKTSVWKRELNYRKKNNIIVEEHSYDNEAINNIVTKKIN